jgi:hypothetical protein
MLLLFNTMALAVPAGRTSAELLDSEAAPMGHCGRGEVLMMQGDGPPGSFFEGKTVWMYAPIIKTLYAGLNASIKETSDAPGIADYGYWTIKETMLGDQKPKTVSVPKPSADCGAVARAAENLTECDVFIWVGGGPCRPTSPFMSALTARGVHTIYYATEPNECSFRRGEVLEEWHYSRTNADRCKLRADSPAVQRFVPPGYDRSLDVLLQGGANCGPCHDATAVNMLTLQTREPEKMNAIQGSLAASGFSLAYHSDVWSEDSMRDLLVSQCMFGNVHKSWPHKSDILEAVRLATLLSSGSVVISEPSAPADEEAFAGLVDFARFEDFGTIASRRAPTAATKQHMRRNHFKERFAPEKLFKDAGIHLLLTSLTGRAKMRNLQKAPKGGV